MSDINIKMNIDDVVAKTQQFLKLNAQQEEALKSLVRTTVNLNEKGKATSAYFEAQISANQKLVTSIAGIGTTNEQVQRKIAATTTALQRQRDAVQALLSEQNRSRVGKVAGVVDGAYSAQELARIEKIRTAIGKLDTETVNPAKIKEFFSSIKAGDIPEATGALAKLRDELVKLNNVREQSINRKSKEKDEGTGGLSPAELQRRAALRARNFADTFKNQTIAPIADNFGIDPDKLTKGNEAQIRKIGSNIARIIRSSISEDSEKIVDNKSLRALIPDLLKGQKLDFINKPELQSASDQLGKLIALFERLRKAQDSIAASKAPKPVDPVKAAAAAESSKRADEFRANFQKTFLGELQKQFNIPTTDLSRRQEGVLRNASASIAKTIATSNSGLDTGKVGQIFDNVRNGGAVLGPPSSETARVASELTKIIGLYERLRQERDRQTRTSQNQADQRLLSGTEAARTERQTRVTQERLRRAVAPDLTKLAGIDPSFDPDKNGQISSLIRKIAELGTKAGLSSRQVADLNTRLNAGSLTSADAQYSRITDRLAKLQDRIEAAKSKAASYQNKGGVSGVGKVSTAPASGGALPPNSNDIDNAKAYSGIYDKIKGTLEYFLVYKGFNLLTNQLSSAFDEARKFQIQVSLIRTISQDSQQSVSQTAAQLVRVSNSSGIGLNEVANAAYDAVSNQITKGKQTEGFIKSASELARTTNSSLSDSVNLLSGAINAYGLDAGDAEEVSAKFFKAIDIGKIKASELANTFGRVAFVGRDLGVSFDEILGTLATLTQKGVTTDDAVTLLTNGMSKLTNPTEKTAALLKELGYATPAAAVGVLKFSGVMKILTQAVQDGRLELSDLFNEIRGEKFASAFKTFNTEILANTKTIGKDSGPTYEHAKDIRGESDADKITKQINQLKNTLSQTFGNELTSLVKQFIDASGGVDQLAANLERLTKVVLIGGVAFLTYKGAILIAQVATGIYNGAAAVSTGLTNGLSAASVRLGITRAAATTSTTINTGATVANTAAMNQNRIAYIAHPIGLLLAAGAAVYAYYQTQNTQILGVNESLQNLDDTYKKLLSTQKEATQDNAFAKYAETLDKAKDQFGNLGQKIASELAVANAGLDRSKDKAKSTADALKEGFEKYINFTKDRISDVVREYNKFDDRIKNSNKSILDIRETTRRLSYETNLKYSGGFEVDKLHQRENIEVAELKRLKDEIAKLYASGSDEDLQKARQLTGEYLRQRKVIFDIQEERKQKSLEADLKANPDKYRSSANENGVVVRGVDTSRLDKQFRADEKFFDDLEAKVQAKAKTQHDTDERTANAGKAALLKTENAIKEFDNIKIFDKNGGVSKDFADKTTGKVDFPKVRKALSEAATKAKASLGKTAPPEILKEIDKLFGERLLAIEQEISAAEKVNTLTQQQNQAREGVKNLSQAFQDGKKDLKNYGESIDTVAGQLKGLVEGLKQFTGKPLEKVLAEHIETKTGPFGGKSQTGRNLNELFDRLTPGKPSEIGTSGAGKLAAEKLKPLREEADAIQRELDELPKKTITKDGVQILNPDVVKGILTRVKDLKDKIKAELRDSVGGDNVAIPGNPQAKSIPELDAIEALLNKTLTEGTTKYNQSIANLDALTASTGKLTTDLSTTLDSLNKIGPATAALGGAGAIFSGISGDVNQLNLKLDETLKKLAQIKLNPAAPPPRPDPANLGLNDPNAPGVQQPKAFGGMIERYASGGAVGSDNQIVAAQAGEYIWNRRSTSQYYSQISAMNRQGRTPVSFNQTTGDTIHVGGININESKNGQSTAADVMNSIRRQQRRG